MWGKVQQATLLSPSLPCSLFARLHVPHNSISQVGFTSASLAIRISTTQCARLLPFCTSQLDVSGESINQGISGNNRGTSGRTIGRKSLLLKLPCIVDGLAGEDEF